MKRKIKILNKILRFFYTKKPSPVLPELFFLIGTYFFPQVNVELLIIYDNNILLTWRDDEFGNSGWHMPGGILRPNELLKNRINKVLETELSLCPLFSESAELIHIEEVILSGSPFIRSHFISFVYKINTSSSPINTKNIHEAKLFKEIPVNLIENHQRYRNLILKYALKS